MNEQWKPIVGYEGLYEVSDLGRVRSLARTRRGRPGRTCKVQERIIAPVCASNDHWIVTLSKDGPRRTHWLHIVVLTAFVGPCPAGLQCRHLDGDPSNNQLNNLKWGTPLENAADRERHGRTPRGEASGTAILNETQVRDIKRRLGPHGAGKRLADEYGVSVSVISDIKTGATWSHV